MQRNNAAFYSRLDTSKKPTEFSVHLERKSREMMTNATYFHAPDHRFQASCAATVGLLTTHCATSDDSPQDSFAATVGQLRCKSPTVAGRAKPFPRANDAKYRYSFEAQRDKGTFRRMGSTRGKKKLFQNIAFYRRFFPLSFLK